MKIWILRERWDWHNDDPEDETQAFTNKEDALTALWLEFRRYEKAWYEDIDWREEEDERATIVTYSEDYYTSWVEEIELK